MDHPLSAAPDGVTPGSARRLPEAAERTVADELSRPRWWLLPLALVTGLAWGFAFGQTSLALLGLVGLVPLPLLLEVTFRGGGRWRRRSLLVGWLHGFGTWFAALPWIAPTLTTFGGIPPLGAWALLSLLAGYLGLYIGVWCWLVAPLWARVVGVPQASGSAGPKAARRGWLAASLPVLGMPAWWVVLELIRGWMISGFPWNPAAHAWLAVPGALPLAAWTGVWGVSFLVVLSAVVLALAWVRRDLPGARDGAVVLVLTVALVLAVAARSAPPSSFATDFELAHAAGGAGHVHAPAALPVALIQPNIPNLVVFDAQVVIANTERLFALSRAACARPGTLLIWPESAAWPYVFGEDPYLDAAVRELARRGCPVLLNAPRAARVAAGEPPAERPRIENTALLVDADGLVAAAGKRHLVPFGEYVPMGKLVPWIGKLARAAGDFSPASEVVLLPVGEQKLGTSICFEVIFPSEVAALTAAGATALVSITNDAWYGDTAAPWQHLAAARFRAAENRRTLLRVAITGVSAVIGPDGRVIDQLGVGETGVMHTALVGRTDRSPYSRTPWLVPLLAMMLAVAASFQVRRERRPAG